MVKAEAILIDILYDRPVKYDNETIEGDLDLSKLDLPKDEKGRALIRISIEIKASDIDGVVNFGDAVFEEPVSFGDNKFSGFVDFRRAKFVRDADFYRSEFGGDAYFEKADFGDHANFAVAHFGRIADFSEALFNADADFAVAKFDDIAGFGGVQFNGDAIFDLAQFSDHAYFVNAEFNTKLKFYGTKFDKLYISWNSIKNNLVYDGPTYLALIKNFKIIERFADADNCHYQYRKESQDRKRLYSGESSWDWSKLSDIASWISCGYGVRPIHTFICMFCIVVIGWVFFIGSSESLFESFYFSVMTFTGGDPDNLMLGRWLRTVAMIEAIFGYLFMALFVVVLGRKFIR